MTNNRATTKGGEGVFARYPALGGHLAAALPALLAVVLFFPAIRGDFVWDDRQYLTYLPSLRKEDIEAFLSGSFLFSPNYFRPLALMSFVLEFKLLGLHPVYFHLDNVILHGLNTLLLGIIAHRLTGSPRHGLPAMAAGIFYGLHPTMVEPVAWISCRFDLLLTFFLLVAIAADLFIARVWPRATVVATAFFLALLSKEMAVAFPIVLAILHWARVQAAAPGAGSAARLLDRDAMVVYGSLVAALILYFAIRTHYLGYLLAVSELPANAPESPAAQLWLMGATFLGYVRVLFEPWLGLPPFHVVELPMTASSNGAWFGLILIVAIAIALLRMGRRTPVAARYWLAFPAALLPVSNLLPVPIGDTYMANRFLAFPLALAAVALVISVLSLSARFRPQLAADGGPARGRALDLALLALLGIWAASSAVAVSRTIPKWHDDVTLWRWIVASAPLAGSSQINLIEALKKRGAWEEAIAASLHALEVTKPGYHPVIRKNLGYFYLERREFTKAIAEFRLALEMYDALGSENAKMIRRDLLNRPKATTNARYVLHLNLGYAYAESGEQQKALGEFLAARALEPNEPTAHYNLGRHFLDHGDKDEAAKHLARALELYQGSLVNAPERARIAGAIEDTRALLAKASAPN